MDYRYCPVCAAPLVMRRDTEGHIPGEPPRERPACPHGHWTHWNNPLPVLAAITEIDGRILLARNAAWPEKKFALITGFMEAGETPEQGVARELREETALSASEIRLVGVYEFIRKNELIIAYHVKASGEIRLSEELVEYRLVEPDKLRPWPSGTGYAIADWLRSRGYPVQFLDAVL